MRSKRLRIILGSLFFSFCLAMTDIATAQPASSPAGERLKRRRVFEAIRALDQAASIEPGKAFIALYEKARRTNDPDYLEMLVLMAGTQQSLEDYPKADEFYLKALAVVRSQKDKEEKFLGPVLHGLGMNQIYQLKHEKAVEYLTQGLSEVKKRRGPMHLDTAHQYLGLAMATDNSGNQRLAESYYYTAMRIYQARSGIRHPRTATAYREIGTFYGENGDYDKAIEYLNNAYLILRTEPSLQYMIAPLFVRLGKYHRRKKDYDTALQLYNNAKALLAKKYGATHDNVVEMDSYIGRVYEDQGKYKLALRLYRNVAAQLGKSDKPDLLALATSYNNIGYTEFLLGRSTVARKNLRRSLALLQKVLSEDHLHVANTMNSLAMVECIYGDKTLGTRMLAYAAAKYNRSLDQLMSVGSEASKLAYLERLRGKTDFSIDNHFRFNPKSLAAAKHAFDVILHRKGRVLDALSRHGQGFERTLSTREKRKYRQLLTLRRTLSAQLTRATFTGQATNEAQLKGLRTRIESLEQDLARTNPARMKTEEAPTLEKVAKRLPQESALLEYFVYIPFDPAIPKAQDHLRPKRLALYVVFPDGRLRWADMGELKKINALITAFRSRLQAVQPIEKEAAALYELLVGPVAAELKPVKTLIIAPDGALNLLPFAALKEKSGRFLLESFQISYLGCARELLRQRHVSEQSGDLVIMANPDYGRPTKIGFTPLPGTAQEAELLAGIMPRAKVFVGAAAREDVLKKLTAPKVLHIATHGFFADTAGQSSHRGLTLLKKPENDEKKTTPAYQLSPMTRMRNPMARSGLALAGANLLENAGEDGILTALEVTSMNLHGTELVVLSACETGIGQIHAGEGVFGLRRALVAAGSQTQVMSLWQVGDDATKDLMNLFYQGLRKGMGRSQAMRTAQQTMFKGKNKHPFYWAAFILSGEWTPLSVKKKF